MDPFPVFRGWYHLEGCAGHLGGYGRSARDEHPLVASGGQVRGGGVKSGRWDCVEKRVARGLHVLLPVCAHAGDTCVIFLSG